MDTKIQQLAKKLGAEVVGIVSEYSAGAFGVAKIARALRERLEREPEGLGGLGSGRDAQHCVDQLRREWDDRP